MTGRFRRHEGHFDPGQRLANIIIVGLLAVLVVTGATMVLVKTGPILAVTALAHRLSTIAFTVVIVGHIVIAAGIVPGYRGAWRSMHLGGRLRLDTARRLWLGWTERQPGRSEAPMGATSRHGEAARARAASNGEARVTG